MPRKLRNSRTNQRCFVYSLTLSFCVEVVNIQSTRYGYIAVIIIAVITIIAVIIIIIIIVIIIILFLWVNHIFSE